jgi:hypothetical protein
MPEDKPKQNNDDDILRGPKLKDVEKGIPAIDDPHRTQIIEPIVNDLPTDRKKD